MALHRSSYQNLNWLAILTQPAPRSKTIFDQILISVCMCFPHLLRIRRHQAPNPVSAAPSCRRHTAPPPAVEPRNCEVCGRACPSNRTPMPHRRQNTCRLMTLGPYRARFMFSRRLQGCSGIWSRIAMEWCSASCGEIPSPDSPLLY